MKAPTMPEIEEMLQQSMDELRKESGGDFDEHATAFFSTGFRLGVLAMMQRVALEMMPTEKGKH